MHHLIVKMNGHKILLSIFLVILAGCGQLQSPESTDVSSENTSTPASEPAATVDATQAPADVGTLRIWLPPQFDPQAGTQAGGILQARLDEFVETRSGLQIEVRVKDAQGPGGLLDTLTTASAAGPLALPDLIALPRDLLESAALKGLLRPYDDVGGFMDEEDWYGYANQLAKVQDSTFGLPFAGDALIMAYRPVLTENPPDNWRTTLEITQTVAFPAADSLSLFTLAQYQGLGGSIQDEEGRPFLNAEVLSEVLTFYSEAEGRGVMPYWITQYQTYNQVWDAFLENQADIVIIWSSLYLENMVADTDAAHIFTADGSPFTLATGWVWALPSSSSDNRMLSIQLAEFLCGSEFMAKWTQAAGYLPTRRSALEEWSNASLLRVMGRVVSSAYLIPSADVLTSLASPLEHATVVVLKQESDAITAAQDAAESLQFP